MPDTRDMASVRYIIDDVQAAIDFCINNLGFEVLLKPYIQRSDGSAKGVKVLKQGFNVDPLLQKQADCISTMTYNEYWQVIDAGIKPE